MLLREAYARLEFEPPVRHELQMASRLALVPGGPMTGVRRIGTSARMLIELYLDLHRATQILGSLHPGRIRFLVLCLNRHQGQHLLEWLRTIHNKLNLDVDIGRVTFHPSQADARRLAGFSWPSWGVFCDHAVLEDKGLRRPLGPHGLVRAVSQIGENSWRAVDRDGNLVCRLTRTGALGLIASTCPVTFHYLDDLASVTFAAWHPSDLDFNLRLLEAFKPS